ncbi:hypothetical protein [Mesorhizobium sp. KR1-2]|uniref:hypothetical protein n=1 Tax=Mesorhizobium sp. KR1-2 TaxID=3156609 RepID=UPI0032B6046F
MTRVLFARLLVGFTRVPVSLLAMLVCCLGVLARFLVSALFMLMRGAAMMVSCRRVVCRSIVMVL